MGELASRIRAKYPGSYDALSDSDLESKVTAKYPGVYDHLVGEKPSYSVDLTSKKALATNQREMLSRNPDFQALPKREQQRMLNQSTVNSAWDYAAEPLRFGSEAATMTANAGLRGLKSVASMVQGGGEAIRTGDIDAGLQKYNQKQAEFQPMQSPMAPSATGKMISDFAEQGVGKLSDLTGRPDIVEPVAQAAMDVGALMGLRAAAPTIIKGGKATLKSLTETTPAKLDSVISKQYQKAVRPSVTGTAGNYNQFAKSNKRSVEGVYDIVKAKDRGELKLGDEMAGQAPTNRLPESMQEHLQAITQAKGNTFAKYDALKREAGEAGATIDLNPIANELYKASSDTVLNDLRPSTVEYMKKQADTLKNRKTYTVEEAQKAIATLNKDVESFYRNPSPDMAGKIVVDASVVRQMRKLLDESIEAESGAGYQSLKNEYGRLTSMEKEAGHRARVAGRAAPSSLIDAIGGYLGSGEIVSGILSLNPALIAKGGTMLALKNYIKRINSPDLQIKRMYKIADKKYIRNKGATP